MCREIHRRKSARRPIVTGDFSQIIGLGSRARLELRLALQETFPPSMTIATSALAFQGRSSFKLIRPVFTARTLPN